MLAVITIIIYDRRNIILSSGNYRKAAICLTDDIVLIMPRSSGVSRLPDPWEAPPDPPRPTCTSRSFLLCRGFQYDSLAGAEGKLRLRTCSLQLQGLRKQSRKQTEVGGGYQPSGDPSGSPVGSTEVWPLPLRP